MANLASAVGICRNNCCTTEVLQEGKCSALLPPKPRLVVDCEKYKQAHEWTDKICDGLVFWHHQPSRLSLAVVELKGGRVPSDALLQLQRGAQIAEVLANAKVWSFAAIIMTNQAPHALDYRVFNRGVMFAGRKYPVQIVKCGKPIQAALPWAAAR
jgi:hypothetical protein